MRILLVVILLYPLPQLYMILFRKVLLYDFNISSHRSVLQIPSSTTPFQKTMILPNRHFLPPPLPPQWARKVAVGRC